MAYLLLSCGQTQWGQTIYGVAFLISYSFDILILCIARTRTYVFAPARATAHFTNGIFTKFYDFLPFYLYMVYRYVRNKKLRFLLICWSSKHGNYIFFYQKPYTGCSDAKRDNVSSNYRIFELKITKLKGISMFIGNGHLTSVLWIQFWSHSMASTASNKIGARNPLK